MEQFDISSKGFLPDVCCEDFSKNYEYLQLFLNIMNTKSDEDYYYTVNTYILKEHQIEQDIKDVSLPEQKYIYSTCSILAHKYVWMFDEKQDTVEIPYCLAKPWYESAEVLGIKCVLTHAAVDLYNWRLKNITKPFDLNNIESINLMKGNLYNYSLQDIKETESMFYLIMVTIEGSCGSMVHNMEKIYQLLEDNNISEHKRKDEIFDNLQEINELLIIQYQTIMKLDNKCNPDIFYNHTRKYLWGSSKTKKGWYLQGINIPPLKEDGASAAQSSLISLEDIFFSVEHKEGTKEFLNKMRQYMPKKHRNYLEYCESRPKLKDYIQNNMILEEYFNSCIDLIVKFRKNHLGIVHRFVIEPSNKNSETGTGTGGTSPKEFLKQVIDETKEATTFNYKNNNFIRKIFFYITLLIMIVMVLCNF